MRARHLIATIAFAITPSLATELPPLTGGTLDGVPLAKALASIEILDEWRLPQGGFVRLLRVKSGEVICTNDGDTDTDYCDLETLYLSAYEAPTVPMDHALFRLPQKINWRLATKGTIADRKLVLSLNACEAQKHDKAIALKPLSYVLRIGEGVSDTPKGAHYVFSASLEPTSSTAQCFD